MIRTLLLTAGLITLGVWLKNKPALARAALPAADGSASDGSGGDDNRALLDGREQQRPAALEAGMPADRSSDADVVRPGFADYARGA
jgi:hypothetical protein